MRRSKRLARQIRRMIVLSKVPFLSPLAGPEITDTLVVDSRTLVIG